MGARASRPRPEAEQQAAPPPGPPPPQTYAQYPAPQTYPQPGPPVPPAYYPPATNGQYYGGYRPQPHPHPHPPPPYPIAPPPYPPRGAYPHAPPRGSGPAPPPAPPAPAPTRELAQTATIRNAVNLKKASLAVTPLPDDPTKLAITFAFDASAPCAATTFVGAAEAAARGGRLTPAKQPPAPAILFDRGLGHRFPGDAAAAAAHVIDLSLYGADPLRSGPLAGTAPDTYPLVVRLEVVTERGLKAGHSLSELAPGAEQRGWAQSQTTFATLRREEDGAWAVRVLKQKIWVEGVSYELQEIYGLEHAHGSAAAAAAAEGVGGGAAARPGSAGADDESEERLCVICLVSPRDTTVLPCRHMCMCHECAQELRKQSSKCPICRNQVESLLHIRINHGERGGGAAASKQRSGAAGAAVPATA